MRQLTTGVERTIDAPAHDIWAYRLDFSNLPAYNAAVQGIRRTDESGDDNGQVAVGATYQFDLVSEAGTHPIELRITEAVPGELVAIDMGGALPARERFTVVPAAGSPDGRPCLARIDLTLLVPDHFPAAHDDTLVANGEVQMAGELQRMQEILEAAARA